MLPLTALPGRNRMSRLILLALASLFFSLPSQAQEDCPTTIPGVALLEAEQGFPALRGQVKVGTICSYYVDPPSPEAQEFVLQLRSNALIITSLDLIAGAGIDTVGSVQNRGGGLFEQRLRITTKETTAFRVRAYSAPNTPIGEEITFYFPRRPRLRLQAPTADCGAASSCLVANRDNLVQIVGMRREDIDPDRSASVAGVGSVDVTILDGAPYLVLKPTSLGSLTPTVTIPVRHLVATTDTGLVTALVRTVEANLNTTVVARRSAVDFTAMNSDSILRSAFAGTVLSVRVRDDNGAVNSDGEYRITQTPDDTSSTLATLSMGSASGGWIPGRLRVVAATTFRASPGNPPLLHILQGKQYVGTTMLALRPRPRVERLEVVRGGVPAAMTALHPGDTVEVYLSGPSVTAFNNFQPEGEVKVEPKNSISGRLALTVTTPRGPAPFYHVRLMAPQEIDTVIRFEATPQQRPRRLDFGRIHHMSDSPDGAVLESFQNPTPMRSLEGVRLVFDPLLLDSARVHGVQYLTLRARLLDHAEGVVDSTVHRIAVVPEGALPYTVAPGYVQTSRVDLDELLSLSTLRTKPHSRLEITLAHDSDKYTQATPRPFSATLRHRGGLVIEPSFTLPTGIYVVADGFSPQLATLLGGAFLDFTYFPFMESRKPLPFNLRTGIMAVDPTFLPPGHRRAKLAPTALLNYNVATVRRNLSLGVSAGVMYLNRDNPDHLLEREDFFLLFSPGLSYTVK